jgi:hypothetical protein
VGTKLNTKKTDSYELKGDAAGINEDAILNGVRQLLRFGFHVPIYHK